MSNVLSGVETIKFVRKSQNTSMLAFSTGKDAIATWLAIRDYFDEVHPYYLYLVPGLEFVEESLDYYERFFGVKIHRLPHPFLNRALNNFMFQAPQNCLVIEQAALDEHQYIHTQQYLAEKLGLRKSHLVADGVRAADSPLRRVSIMRHGAISQKQRKYHPIWDLKKADLVDMFRRFDVKLPIDYKLFGRSFDGIDLRFLLPLKKHLPNDYRKILEWFPLSELEIFRWEQANGTI